MNERDPTRGRCALAADCEHGAESHDDRAASMASAPEASRAWLLIEHPGPWPHEPADAEFPEPVRVLVAQAVERGVRVQLIRWPGRREAPGPGRPRTVLAGWTAGADPWLRRGSVSAAQRPPVDLDALCAGTEVAFGEPVSGPAFLVCAHGRRNVCCARFGGPLVQALGARFPGQVWETTHVGGHRFAANLVILPHGLYYGPVDVETASAAIEAYTGGAVVPGRYRGRAGQPRDVQASEHAQLLDAGSLKVAALA